MEIKAAFSQNCQYTRSASLRPPPPLGKNPECTLLAPNICSNSSDNMESIDLAANQLKTGSLK